MQVWPALTTVGRVVTATAEADVEMLAAMPRARTAGNTAAVALDHLSRRADRTG